MQSICRRLHRCRENKARRVSGKLQHTLCRNPGEYTGCLHNILNKEAKLLLEKWKNDPEKRDKLMKAAAVLIILAVIFLRCTYIQQNCITSPFIFFYALINIRLFKEIKKSH